MRPDGGLREAPDRFGGLWQPPADSALFGNRGRFQAATWDLLNNSKRIMHCFGELFPLTHSHGRRSSVEWAHSVSPGEAVSRPQLAAAEPGRHRFLFIPFPFPESFARIPVRKGILRLPSVWGTLNSYRSALIYDKVYY